MTDGRASRSSLTYGARTRSKFPAPIPVDDQYKLPCSACGARVDPLRAPRVAVFGESFFYFCSPECRVRYVPGSSPPPRMSSAPPRSVGPSSVPASSAPASSDPASDPAPTSSSAEPDLLSAAEADAPELSAPIGPRSPALGTSLVLGLGAALGASLAGTGTWRSLPVLAAVAACAALLLAPAASEARDSDAAKLAPLVAAASALLAWLFVPAASAPAARLAGVVCAVAAASHLWIQREQRRSAARRRETEAALGATSDGERSSDAHRELKPGEELVLRSGDRVPVDAVITAGQARVEPWHGARLLVRRTEEDGLVAGSRVVDGALRAVVRWVKNDRAWARLTLDPSRRADRHASMARLAEQLASRWALGLGVVAGGASWSLGAHPLSALGYAAAVAAALGATALPELVALHISRVVYALLDRGICLRNAAALDRAGRTTSVVFCDHGTLLSGELSVASIEPSGDISESELLGLLAGAHSGVASPLAVALQRALAAQKLRADATRSPDHLPGLGVTAVASNGQPLVAGTRALLLQRRISVASAENRIAELEALGRTVLLVALDGRWVGLVALQDGLRPGARAATQCLIDAGVEPILLSGESRETCRALARHIGIEHVRPEVLPHDRAAEVRRLSQAGGVLAVVGSSIDDAALAAAPLSIDIDARGGPLERCDIDVISGDVRDAALVIQRARELHALTRAALITALLPVALGLVLMVAGMPPWGLPPLGLLGCVIAARRLFPQDAASTAS